MAQSFYIRPEIWALDGLKFLEKGLLQYILALSNNGDGCIAGNRYLGNFFGVSDKTISRAITGFENANYIRCARVMTKHGQKRTMYHGTKCPEGMDKMSRGHGTKCPGINNTEVINNIDYKPPTVPRRGKGGEEYSDDFEEWWIAYPRKVAKKKSYKAWKAQRKELPSLQKHIEIIAGWSKSSQWSKDGGQFIPYPTTWINQLRWEEPVPVEIETPGETFDRIWREA